LSVDFDQDEPFGDSTIWEHKQFQRTPQI